MKEESMKQKLKVYFLHPSFCTDNAAMVGVVSDMELFEARDSVTLVLKCFLKFTA